jgi:folate-binding protein YgfZ
MPIETTRNPDLTAAVPVPPGLFTCALPGLAVLQVSGADAASFLHSQLSSNVNALADGQGQYSSYNSPKGRMLATLVVWRQGDVYRLILARDLAEAMRKRLAMFVLRSKVVLVAEAVALVGAYGDAARAGVAAWCGNAPVPWGSVQGTGSNAGTTALELPDGRILLLTADGSAAPVLRAAAAGDEATWTWLGIRAGVAWVTAATSDQLIAQSANWELVGGVDFKKGCYPGQEIVARMQYLGKLKERLRALHSSSPLVAPGAAIHVAGVEGSAGIVVNAAPAPGGGTDFLAVVRNTALDADALSVDGAPDAAPTLLPLPYAVPALENVRVRL